MSPYGDLAQRKTDYWRTNEGKNLKKIANPQTFIIESFSFLYFLWKFSHDTVLEAKCVGNWKSEILWWAHYLVRNKKIVKFGVYRLFSLDVRRAYASHALPPAPAQRVPPPQHVAETRYRDSLGLSVRNRSPGGWGGGWRESPARPSFPVSIGYTRDGVAIRVKTILQQNSSWKYNIPRQESGLKVSKPGGNCYQ